MWVEATNERGDSVFPPLGGSWSFLKYKIYSKKKDMFPVYTYVFELPFSDIYFTGWLNFSDIFSVFRGLTGFFLVFKIFFTILFFRYTSRSPAYMIHTFASFLLAMK